MENNPIRRHARKFAVLLALNLYGLSMAHAEEILVDQNAKTKQAFVLLQAEMIDRAAFFTKYAIPAEVEVSANGGHALVASFDKKVMEGVWANNWTIMLKFPSMKAATTWYYSPKYQAVIPYRHAATAYGNMVFFEGTPESALNWRVAQYEGVSANLRFPLTLDPTPEYVVTVAPCWSKPNARLLVSASFDEVNAKDAILSLEMKIPKAYGYDGRLATRVFLKDAAGKRISMGNVHARNFIDDQWHKIEFRGREDEDRRGRYDQGRPMDLTKVTSVEIEFGADQKPVEVTGDIQIRNLKIAK